ncbi:MAG: hypothetical protein U0625_07410 [Phycisphaerales bacterium]
MAAQTVAAGAPPAVQAASAAEIDPAAAVGAYFAARGWLDAGSVPMDAKDPDGVRAAAAVLRLRGRTVGFGKAIASGETASRGALVAAAVRMALDAARGHPAVVALPLELREKLGARLALELEVAGAPQPLVGRTFDEVAKEFEPGECGLAMRHGTRWAYQPAAYLLGKRMAAPLSRALLALVSELDLPPRDLPELQEADSTAVYAVSGVRLAQVDPQAPPAALARLLPARAESEAPRGELAATAQAIAARLGAQLRGGPELARAGLRGDYIVAADDYEPPSAAPFEQALTAYALAQVASVPTWPQPLREQALESARTVLRALAQVDAGEADPLKDPAAVACMLLADAAIRAEEARSGRPASAPPLPAETLARLGDAARAALEPTARTMLRTHARAALLAAAALRETGGAPLLPREQLLAALDDAWRTTAAAELVNIAPLLLLAERPLNDPARLSARVQALDAARTVLVETQQAQLPAGARATLGDGIGAYALTGSRAGRASSQSTRAQLLVALLTAEPALQPALPAAEAAQRDARNARSLRLATRFLRQLTADETIALVAPNPTRAVGGVLASPSDASQPLAAQAMALWALAETERALARLEGTAATPPATPAAAPAAAQTAPPG